MKTNRRRRNRSERGSALIAVLWLSAALTAIAFAVATTVRGETERTTTAVEGVKAYYLATGSIDRAILHIEWAGQAHNDDGTPKYFQIGTPVLHYEYPTGVVDVEVIPEASKLNLNLIKPDDLILLLTSLRVPPERAQQIAAAVVDWRTSTGEGPTEIDQYYLTQTPSFRARHTSFQEIEELLLVRGVTSDLFYGQYGRDEQGNLRFYGGLRDCLSVFSGATPGVDVNTADPAVLATLGLSADQVRLVVNTRRTTPIQRPEQLANLRNQLGQGSDKLRIGGNSIVTFRATARLKAGNGQLSDMRRSVASVVKLFGAGQQPTFHVLRWYDDAWKSEESSRP